MQRYVALGTAGAAPTESNDMDLDGQDRSGNFEDRGVGSAVGGGALPITLIIYAIRFLGFKGSVIVGSLLAVGYFLMPQQARQALSGQNSSTQRGTSTGASACGLSAYHEQACDFSRAVLASTEHVWQQQFARNALPTYGKATRHYRDPTLVVFVRAVSTGCGNATSDVGPFYCPADSRLYIDPSFYRTMETKLQAPGDFAQAYVIAHEVGHHVQNLIGSSRLEVSGETKNQVSVRVELQADCFAGVWGNSARTRLKITEADLKEALTAAHSIGDDELGHQNTDDYTHGSAKQRMYWFKRGFDSGDPKTCDTFAVRDWSSL